MIGKKLKLENS